MRHSYGRIRLILALVQNGAVPSTTHVIPSTLRVVVAMWALRSPSDESVCSDISLDGTLVYVGAIVASVGSANS